LFGWFVYYFGVILHSFLFLLDILSFINHFSLSDISCFLFCWTFSRNITYCTENYCWPYKQCWWILESGLLLAIVSCLFLRFCGPLFAFSSIHKTEERDTI
jgi:hypothetical protein